ncbi:Vacuole effluxer Atg22 like protein [Aquimixticola soesokkakensis]|uniref:Vacuole effluxer Atg22 like protein n=1 Tax=Aquimixticola soesokkakensis TaxID=1519096 RepID=A0A1Y5RHJ5_9RHOB|nr:MFS transporter [Aquimixticola soesokkakensis]SLN15009.1 Vacuole effluxer Atg22 like protein [Aquimixticola soesokkakensis]
MQAQPELTASRSPERALRKRIRGWMMYDWASQPYHTLIVTFIFGPYFAEQVIAMLMAGGMDAGLAKATAQSWWGWALSIVGVLIALGAPVLGSIADGTGRRLPWIWVFSAFYVVGAAGLWIAVPSSLPVVTVLVFFGIGMIGIEFTTIFTNALLPALGPREQVGRISGSGWAWGYVGGLIALLIMLLFFAENAAGVTLLGIAPLFGFEAAAREGTRFVGPFTALWYVVAMVPFYLWVKEPRGGGNGLSVRAGLRDLGETLRSLPRRRSLFAYLGSSMFYRDALNGMYTFGGIYAIGVLDWSVIDIGVFGILGLVTGALFAWLGGRADARFGPRSVIIFCIFVLIATAIAIVLITRTSVFGIAVPASSSLPDVAFYVCGGLIGAAGGAIQSASRTMMVHQSDPKRMTEAFGLFALSGKATSFLAPALIALVTQISGSQRAGITPLILLFLIGLVLLLWVKSDGSEAAA